MTTSPEKSLEEAAKAVGLHKIHEEDFFSNLGESSNYDGLCTGIELRVHFNRTEVKELCSKLVRVLEKLSKADEPKRNNYCSYIRYWLYEKISEIHTNKFEKIADVPFFDKLILAWTVMNMGILKRINCKSENIKDVKLNELKNRIFSYIYFKNLKKIKAISTSENGTDCDKYLTYLKSFKSIHDEYMDRHCGSLTVSSPNGTDYFSCNDKYELTSLINVFEKCKSVEKPNPETVPDIPASDKVDSGQKVSESTTRPTDSAVVATSSSSSDTVTTTTTVTSTQPATTATTVTANQPTIKTATSTTPSTATTTHTGTMTITRSSGSKGEPSFWSGVLGFFVPGRPQTSERTSSLGASQTSSSSSRTSGSRAPASSVTTTSVKGSTVTVTTNTPRAAGSISSTGQVGLTRPLAEAAVPAKSLSHPQQGSPGYVPHTVSPYNSNSRGDTNSATIADVSGASETLYDKLDSNTIKNMIMAAAVLGIIFFLFYYNRSSRIESSIKPKKRKKKKFEHNYYEEYEKELEMYGSEETFLDSETDRLYLNYQPEGDSHY